jgi:hypothetical protein
MRRIAASVASLSLVLALPSAAQNQKTQDPQPMMVECRDLSSSDNFIGPNESLINGKACRPAGSPLTVNLTNPAAAPKVVPARLLSTQPAPAAAVPAAAPAAAPAAKDDPQSVVPAGPTGQFILEEGTPIKLVLSENLSSADAQVGQEVSFEVVEDVLIQGIVVVPKGATAWATITAAEHKRRLGRAGKLDLNLDKVRLSDGEKALIKATKDAQGGGHTGAMVGAMAATAIFTLGGSALFLLMHGKDITIPKGTAVTAFIQGDDVLDRSKFEKYARAN